MITKAELDKMVDERAEMFTAHILNDGNWISIQKDCNSDILESAYIAGGKCVTGILMPEIERVENNCDTLENKAIFWMETNDRAIEHTESLQLTITTLKTEIQSLKDERDSAIKAMDYHINSDMRTQEKIQSLKDEIEVLRRYGNKDCTAMADEALAQKAEVVDKCPPHSWDASGERCTKCGDKDWMT